MLIFCLFVLVSHKFHSESEKELVNRVLQGDRHAFRQIIGQTEKLVFQIVSGFVPGKEDREDISQDIYLKAFHNLGSFRFQAKLSTWIARIAYNTCLNFLQKKKLPLLHLSAGSLEEEPVGDDSPIQVLSQKQIAAILQEGINSLSPLHKTLITLYHQGSFSLTEIAEITGLPQGTVKSYLFRARKALQKQLLILYKQKELL